MPRGRDKRRPTVTPTARDARGYEYHKLIQRIQSENLFENLEFDPPAVPWIYIDNVISRVLARMVGQGPYGPVVAKCTEDGSLAVVSRGGAFDQYTADGWSFSSAVETKNFVLDQQVNRIDIFCYNGTCGFRIKPFAAWAYEGWLDIMPDAFYSLDFLTKEIEFMSGSFSPKSQGDATSDTYFHLVDSGADFVTDGVNVGDEVANTDIQSFATVVNVTATDLTLSLDAFPDGDEHYVVEGTSVKIIGWYRAGG